MICVVTDDDRVKVKEYLKQACAAQYDADRHKEEVKDILNVLKEQYDISPKVSRKVIVSQVKGNFPELNQENTDFADLYTIVS